MIDFFSNKETIPPINIKKDKSHILFPIFGFIIGALCGMNVVFHLM